MAKGPKRQERGQVRFTVRSSQVQLVRNRFPHLAIVGTTVFAKNMNERDQVQAYLRKA